MKVFVATEPIDEDRDFSFTIPGELVHLPPLVCDCSDCGCDRAMAGFVSHKATTSFVVRDLDLDPKAYSDLLFHTETRGLDERGVVRRRGVGAFLGRRTPKDGRRPSLGGGTPG